MKNRELYTFASKFQFQDGAIKGISENNRKQKIQKFQFQDGAIKGLVVYVSIVFSPYFNSKMVRLRAI